MSDGQDLARAKWRTFGLTDDLASKLLMRQTPSEETQALVGHSLPGLLIPYFDFVGKPLVAFGAAAAGTRYAVDNTTGAVEALAGSTAPAAGKTYIGHTIEAGRLIVNVAEK